MFKQTDILYDAGYKYDGLKLYFMSCEGRPATSHVTGGYTTLTWNIPADNSDMTSTTWTCPKDGLYKFISQIAINGKETSTHYQLNIIINGADAVRFRENQHMVSNPSSKVETTRALKQGDTVYVRSYQASGATRSVYGGSNLNYFQVIELPTTDSNIKRNPFFYKEAAIDINSGLNGINTNLITSSTKLHIVRVGKMTTIQLQDQVSLSASVDGVVFYGLIPAEFRPKETASIIHNFNYASGSDFMYKVDPDGTLTIANRDMVDGIYYGWNVLRVNSLTYISRG